MTRWHWVRHGPTHQTTLTGWRDVPADLSDIARIARLSAALPEAACMVSSDLMRAVTTADALSLPDRRRLPHDAALRELDFGIWDGMPHDAVSARDPVLSRAFWEQPGDIRAPDGESWNACAARASAAVDLLNGTDPAADIIAVAHFGVILTQLQRALGVSAPAVLGQKIDPLSVTTLCHDSGVWSVGRINHTP